MIEYWDEFYKEYPACFKTDLKFLDDYSNGTFKLMKNCHIDWLMVAIHHNHMPFIKAYMQMKNVPDTLTLKQQIAYLQLFSKN